MKSIRISHSVKQVLSEYEESYNESVNNLIDLVDEYMPLTDLSDESSVIINIEDDTVDKLESYKLTKGESIENVFVRMLIIAQVLNSSDD